MAFESFKSVETKEVMTAPNALTAVRAIGGATLGVSMARYNLDPALVAVTASTLAATDMEGSLIVATKRWSRLQERLRIIPSRLGRLFDPIADKLFAVSVFAGGLASGAIPEAHAVGILAAESSTAAATGLATIKGVEPEVTKAGKAGMLARCGTIGFDLTAAASESQSTMHDALASAGHISAATATVLGFVSCYQIFQQSRPKE